MWSPVVKDYIAFVHEKRRFTETKAMLYDA